MNVELYDSAVKLLALSKYGAVSPRLFESLFNRFGSLDSLLAADQSELIETFENLPPEQALRISQVVDHLDLAAEILEQIRAREIKVITCFDETYPGRLTELNDPPLLLFLRGRLPSPDLPSVGLVGTSRADNEALEMTTRLARLFIEQKVQVVSGLSLGISAAAHLGSKSADGSSFAVLDAGFDEITGTDLMPVAIDIAQSGGVISEFLPDHESSPYSYKTANRLLVGMVNAVVVTGVYETSMRTLDLLKFCNQIGKLTFVMIDPEYGAFADEKSLARAVTYGAVPVEGWDHVQDIVQSLV